LSDLDSFEGILAIPYTAKQTARAIIATLIMPLMATVLRKTMAAAAPNTPMTAMMIVNDHLQVKRKIYVKFYRGRGGLFLRYVLTEK
jgi:hypothetical protein